MMHKKYQSLKGVRVAVWEGDGARERLERLINWHSTRLPYTSCVLYLHSVTGRKAFPALKIWYNVTATTASQLLKTEFLQGQSSRAIEQSSSVDSPPLGMAWHGMADRIISVMSCALNEMEVSLENSRTSGTCHNIRIMVMMRFCSACRNQPCEECSGPIVSVADSVAHVSTAQAKMTTSYAR